MTTPKDTWISVKELSKPKKNRMKKTLIISMLIIIYLIGVCIKKEIEIERLNKKYSDLQDKIIQISIPKTTN